MNSKLKYVVAVGAVLLITVILGSIKFFQISKAIAEHENQQMPPTAVTTAVAKTATVESTFRGVGELVAVQGATLSAELAGRVQKVAVREGAFVEKGSVLIELDTGVELANLNEAQAQLIAAEKAFTRAKTLVQQTAISQRELDNSTSEVGQARARVASLQAVIDRKIIKAPFSGTLGIPRVKPGDYVTMGSALVPLYALDNLNLDFSVPQRLASELKVGKTVGFKVDSFDNVVFQGNVSAIDPSIDQNSRTVYVRALINNRDNRLKPGMFGDVELAYGVTRKSVLVPISSVKFAPYGDTVWAVSAEKKVAPSVVKLGERRGDFVEVLSGVNEGSEVVTSGVFKLAPGMSVLVRNDLAPPVSSNPKPADT